MVPPLVFAEGGDTPGGQPVKPPEKAKTIEELVQRYSSESCIECHEDIYYQWENSLHARSILGTPRTAPTILTTIDKGLKKFEFSGVKKDEDITVENLMICAKCHLPQLEEATDDVAVEIVKTIR
ncbi:MAG: multiheme c-type cytochrome, partial [Thermodesulfobacteriota bacterium]